MLTTRLHKAILRLIVLLCCWPRTRHSVLARNITVGNGDSSIMYSPPGSWYPSWNLCSTCLNPSMSLSFYEGINLGSSDAAQFTTTGLSSTPTSSSPVPPSSPTPPAPRQFNNDDLDTPVTISFNFTGSAIYIFCIQPLGAADVGGTPTNMNLFFTVDNQPSGTYSSAGTPGGTGFMPNQNVLSLGGLSDQPHQLVVNVGDDSVFIFDHLIYTDDSVGNSNATTVLPTSTTAPPTVTARVGRDNDNVATFGGAIGGSVGVLSLVSLGIAISIIRRRMLAARRDRLDEEANATTRMIGPMPFVPRYFPDTVIPSDPPTYNDALSSTNHNSAPLLASLSSTEYSSRQRSYADIPPASPVEDMPPPPPFPLALSAPIITLIPALGVIPSISVTDQPPDNLGLVGNSSNFTTSPESAPLLPSDTDMRPDPRTFTSPPESHETPGD